jgi:hypothetical protein
MLRDAIMAANTKTATNSDLLKEPRFDTRPFRNVRRN